MRLIPVSTIQIRWLEHDECIWQGVDLTRGTYLTGNGRSLPAPCCADSLARLALSSLGLLANL